MNFQLAKQLKDAGFPQSHYHGYEMLYGPKYSSTGMPVIESEKHQAMAPKLEELINMCGKKFGNLALHVGKQWIAEPAYEISMDVPEGAGTTPEDAVARLWLNLKSSKTVLKRKK